MIDTRGIESRDSKEQQGKQKQDYRGNEMFSIERSYTSDKQ